MSEPAEAELREVTAAWDRAMVTNDSEAIGRLLADDRTIILVERATSVLVRQQGRWRCVLTHLSEIASA